MNARLLLRTSVIGVLAASLFAGTPAALASQPSGDSDARVAVTGQPAAVPTAVTKLEAAFMILDAYQAIKQCASDGFGGSWWECFTGAFTGPSIQDVLDRIDKLEEKIDRNHAELMSRLGQLENNGNKQTLQTAMSLLAPLGNTGDDANRAWMAVLGCMRAQSEGQATCADYTGTQRPIADASRDNHDEFLRIMEAWRSENLPTIVQRFAGREGEIEGVVQAGWRYFRTLQNNNAGVPTDSPVRRSDRTPVVTHALSEQMNVLLEYYQDLITRYAYLSAMADGMRTAVQLNCSHTDLAACRENRVQSWQSQARRWIDDDANRYSVAGAVKHYAMPVVPVGAIAVVNQREGGERAFYFAGDGGQTGLTWRNLGALADSLQLYAPPPTLTAAYPGSFPSGGWYTARMKVRRGTYNVYGCRTTECSRDYWVFNYVVNAPGLGDTPCLVRGRPVDEVVEWDPEYQKWMRAWPHSTTPEDLWVDIAGSDWEGRYIPFEKIWNGFIVKGYADSIAENGGTLFASGSGARRVDWDWDRRGPINGYKFGWGGSVKCGDGPQSTFTEITARRDYPLFGRP